MARMITAPGIVRNVNKYLNSMRKVPFAVGIDDWVSSEGSFTAEFANQYITTSSFEIGTYDRSIRDNAKGDIVMEKKDGGGGMVFTTAKKPTGVISGTLYVFDNNDNKIPVILESTVVPIENGGTEATTEAGIRQNIGLGSASDAKETLGFGDTVLTDIANNLTTSAAGYALDARQGKALKDSIDTLNGQIGQYTNADGTLQYITTGDVRTINKSGRYYVRSTVSNLPNATSSFLDVYVYTLDEGGYKRLIVRPYNSLKSYECRCVAGVWSEWESLSDQIANTAVVKVTGTTANNNTDEATVAYPTGYTNSNCVIIGSSVQYSNGSWFSNYESNYCYSNNTGIHMKVDLSGFQTKPFVVLLMKIPS